MACTCPSITSDTDEGKVPNTPLSQKMKVTLAQWTRHLLWPPRVHLDPQLETLSPLNWKRKWTSRARENKITSTLASWVSEAFLLRIPVESEV